MRLVSVCRTMVTEAEQYWNHHKTTTIVIIIILRFDHKDNYNSSMTHKNVGTVGFNKIQWFRVNTYIQSYNY